eukprot:Clim_evm1s8 gene=Clim_evmTU1s8
MSPDLKININRRTVKKSVSFADECSTRRSTQSLGTPRSVFDIFDVTEDQYLRKLDAIPKAQKSAIKAPQRRFSVATVESLPATEPKAPTNISTRVVRGRSGRRFTVHTVSGPLCHHTAPLAGKASNSTSTGGNESMASSGFNSSYESLPSLGASDRSESEPEMSFGEDAMLHSYMKTSITC